MSDCGRCRDCKHWEKLSTGESGDGECLNVDTVSAKIWTIEGNQLFTAFDFGCVQQSMIRKDG